MQRTRVGKAMRATAYDKPTSRLMGINVDGIISITFAIGAALAGAAGVLYATAFPQVNFVMGIIPGLKAFVAAVLGGIGSHPRRAGRRVDHRRSRSAQRSLYLHPHARRGCLHHFGAGAAGPPHRYLRRTQPGKGIKPMLKKIPRTNLLFFGAALLIFVVVQVAISTYILNDFWSTIIRIGGVMAIVSLGLNLIYGYNGQFSLGQWGFYAIGAYTAADITYRWTNNSEATGLSILLIGVLLVGGAIVYLRSLLGKIRGLDALSAFTMYFLATLILGGVAVFLGQAGRSGCRRIASGATGCL